MGVKSCNRKGCENIMCDQYSSEYGYICYECVDELNLLLKEKNNLENYHQVIKNFMGGSKKNKITFFESSEDCINEIFK